MGLNLLQNGSNSTDRLLFAQSRLFRFELSHEVGCGHWFMSEISKNKNRRIIVERNVGSSL